ncbi:MAG: phosphoribosylaminoimidazolesuccinocarboxamide synthase [Verrucomicrobiota bacterium]
MPTPERPLLRRGKVRDIYSRGEELWLVASDRISAYDVIMPTPIPDKGKILTALSRHWFTLTASLCSNHVLGYDLPPDADLPEFEGRLTRARRCEIFPIECIARGHLAGSGWEEYAQHGTVGGFPLPAGLRESDQLPHPLFTPARKNDEGHDENLTEAQARALIGDARYEELRDLTLGLYAWAAAYAAPRGIILADTKLEFGREPQTGRTLLADEIFHAG